MTDLLLDSIQNVSQFRVNDLTRGTLFFTAALTSATKNQVLDKLKRIYSRKNSDKQIPQTKELMKQHINYFSPITIIITAFKL